MPKKNGFTLLEMIVVISIMGVIGMLAAGIINIGVDSFFQSSAHADFMFETNTIFESLLSDIPSAMPGTITVASVNRFKFAKVNGKIIDLLYLPDQLLFTRTESGKTKNLSKHVSKFSFSYGNADGSIWNAGDPLVNVRRLNLNATLTIGTQNQDFNYSFYIRNE